MKKLLKSIGSVFPKMELKTQVIEDNKVSISKYYDRVSARKVADATSATGYVAVSYGVAYALKSIQRYASAGLYSVTINNLSPEDKEYIKSLGFTLKETKIGTLSIGWN